MAAPGYAFLEELPLQDYQERLVSVAHAIVENRADAQDIVQDAWLQLLKAIAEGRGPVGVSGLGAGSTTPPGEDIPFAGGTVGDQVFAWLGCVCRRRATDVLRRRTRRRERRERLATCHPSPAAPPDPSEEIVRMEEREQVRRVLRRLPARQAQLLRMRSDDCSYRQTAAAVGVADASVGYLTVRARSAFIDLKRRLDRESRQPVQIRSTGAFPVGKETAPWRHSIARTDWAAGSPSDSRCSRSA